MQRNRGKQQHANQNHNEVSCQSEWLLSKSLQAINAGDGVEKREPSYTVGGGPEVSTCELLTIH